MIKDKIKEILVSHDAEDMDGVADEILLVVAQEIAAVLNKAMGFTGQ